MAHSILHTIIKLLRILHHFRGLIFQIRKYVRIFVILGNYTEFRKDAEQVAIWLAQGLETPVGGKVTDANQAGVEDRGKIPQVAAGRWEGGCVQLAGGQQVHLSHT